MSYSFRQHEEEPEPQAAGSRMGPPRKYTAAGVLDPPVPPRKPLSPIPSIPTSLLAKIIAALILLGIVASVAAYFFRR
jgi:hypothetical protein